MADVQALISGCSGLLRGISDFAIAMLDGEGRILFWNAGAQAITGFPEAEILGKPCAQLQTPENVASGRPQQMLQSAREVGRCEDEGWRPRKDGSRFWACAILYAIHDERGEVIGFTEILQDLTDRRRYDQAMRDQDLLLRDSAARHRAIFDSALDGIVTLDENGIVESVNPATEILFGYSASELIGRNVNMLMPAPYQQQHQQYLANYLKTGVRKIIGIGREVIGLRKDGSTFPMDLAVSEMSIGGHRMFTGLIHDVSERKAAEKERERLLASERRARADAERASKAKDDFLAALSHELRTPLTPALLTISLLERDKEIPERCRADLDVVRRNVEMEARLIDDLLDLTRIMNKKMTMHFENVDAHQILWNAERTSRSEDGIEITFDLAAAEHHVRADPARLQQVFWNILSNARKFTPIGGRIVVHSFNPTPDRITFEITDSGKGIEPELLPRIFNAFEQGDPQTARGFGGLGLGLTITKAIIDAHGGTIEASSPGKGRGSRFRLALSTVPVGVPASSGMSSPADTEPKSLHPLRILLVEDHEPTLRVVSRLLRDLRHEVHPATTVRDAIQMLDTHPFDLLISDLGLPDGSGYEVMEYAAEHHHLKGIALSGYGMTEDIERSRDAGFANHLIKPVDIQTLMNAVSEVCAV